MTQKLQSLIEEQKKHSFDLFPKFYRLVNAEDLKNFNDLLEMPGISVLDEILSQVEEYVKSQNPKTVFNKQQLTEAAKKHIGNIPHEQYGVWVYYPWSKKLVHLLDEEEFVSVRTNRNQYKITPEEKIVLSEKKIGVIGLSVGQSIALTIAMERICGELRIADFDLLELSNLNRIRSGVHNLGLPKTLLVAREIWEIDPFLKVTYFSEGLTEENLLDFFIGDGKLDVCVEVCDGLHTKIFARQKAKELQIPVVMNSSDRGTTDIERYDLNKNEPILHGLIDHMDINKVKLAKTNEEKVPYLLPMLGVDTSTTRLKASMLEIQETITTWPQLASGVVLGGGICTDVCRRILLKQLNDSGRYFVDLEDIIKDKSVTEYTEQPLMLNPSMSDAEMLNIINSLNEKPSEEQIAVGKDVLEQIVKAAAKAPSGANCQSWKWMYHEKTLYLFFDDIFRPDLLDCQRTTMITGLGSATENLVLKSHELGLEVSTSTVSGINDSSKLISTFKFFKKGVHDKSKLESHTCDYLSSAIDGRVSNRIIAKRVIIEPEKLDKLKEVVKTIPGADMVIIDDYKKLERLAQITARMDRIRYLSKGGHNDFRGEARWTIEEAMRTSNGISFLETMDLTPTEFAGFYVSKDWPVVNHLADWNLGNAFGKIQRKWILGASAVGLITMPEFSTNNFFEGGRALERVWLAANKEGISAHPPSLSTLIFNSVQYSDEKVLPDNMKEEALKLQTEFEQLFGIDNKVGKILLMRFLMAPPPKFRSLRYPVEQILRYS